MASVKENGKFSLFPGYDRSLAILSGEGLKVRVGEGDWSTLRQDSAPLYFSGDEVTEATLIHDEISDFNVFTKRQHYSHTLQRFPLQPNSSHQLSLSSSITTLLCPFGGPISISEKDILIEDGDSCLIEQCDGQENIRVVSDSHPVNLFVINIQKRSM